MATTIAVADDSAAPLPGWAIPVVGMAVFVLYLVTFEGGVVSQAIGQAGNFVHELFHDGRHLIGVPCH